MGREAVNGGVGGARGARHLPRGHWAKQRQAWRAAHAEGGRPVKVRVKVETRSGVDR